MNKDKLEDLWKVQYDFNQKFFFNKTGKDLSDLSMEEKVMWTKNQLLSIVKEAMEVLDETPSWKEHRNVQTDFIPSNLFEEIIDVNKFSMGLAQLWGMTCDQYYDEYLRKSYVVEQRYHQEHDLKLIDKNSKVVGIDVDGVLGDYEKWFLKYCRDVHSINFDSLYNMKKELDSLTYRSMKDAYRQSGWKANMPMVKGASEFTKKLKENGYTVIILTARPYKKFYTIYPDTLNFLNSNDILFDGIVFDKEKHLKIIKEFPNLNFMVEDDIDIAIEIAKLGYKIYFKVNDLNSDKLYKNMDLFDGLNIELFNDFSEVVGRLNLA